jgi:quercetin dioxygenase-like cupin family protein
MTDSTPNTDPAASPQDDLWPAALDALVAAPDHHRLLFENPAVRVLDTRIAPGARTPVHTHRWPSVLYVLSWSAFVRRDAAGQVVLDSRVMPHLAASPVALWSPPLAPHSLENVGATDMRVISVELKQVAT